MLICQLWYTKFCYMTLWVFFFFFFLFTLSLLLSFVCYDHQRFVPSEYGNEVDRVSGLPPFEALLENKRKIRRATEAAGISYTYVSANAFAAYFIDYLLHPRETQNEVIVYGSGEAKGKLNYHQAQKFIYCF